MGKGPMTGLKAFLIGLGLFFLATMIIVIVIGIQQGEKQKNEQTEIEEMSIEEVRHQAGSRR